MNYLTNYLDSLGQENFFIHEKDVSLNQLERRKIYLELQKLEDLAPAYSIIDLTIERKNKKLKAELSIVGGGNSFYEVSWGSKPLEVYRDVHNQIKNKIKLWKTKRIHNLAYLHGNSIQSSSRIA